jgi:WD40 repeat protein
MSIENWAIFEKFRIDKKIYSVKYLHGDNNIINNKKYIDEQFNNIEYSENAENNSFILYNNNIFDPKTKSLKYKNDDINSKISALSPNQEIIVMATQAKGSKIYSKILVRDVKNHAKIIEGESILPEEILSVEWFNNSYFAVASGTSVYIYKYIPEHLKHNDLESLHDYSIVNAYVTLSNEIVNGGINIGTPINCIKWHPRISFLAVGGNDGKLRVININLLQLNKLTEVDDSVTKVEKYAKFKNVIEFEGDHTKAILSLDWIDQNSFKNSLIASGSRDGTVRIWNFLDKKCLYKITIGNCDVKSVSWSPYGNHILSANNYNSIISGRDKTKTDAIIKSDIQIWQLDPKKKVATIITSVKGYSTINMASWDTTGAYIALSYERTEKNDNNVIDKNEYLKILFNKSIPANNFKLLKEPEFIHLCDIVDENIDEPIEEEYGEVQPEKFIEEDFGDVEDDNLISKYDENGIIIGKYDNDDKIIEEYDENGVLIKTYEYDENGKLFKEYDGNGNLSLISKYDENGIIIGKYDIDDNIIEEYNENGLLIKTYEYDTNGNLIQEYDEEGNPIHKDGLVGGSIDLYYKQKYLKYKTKYLQLKNN